MIKYNASNHANASNKQGFNGNKQKFKLKHVYVLKKNYVYQYFDIRYIF